MQTKPDWMPQHVYDWAIEKSESLKETYKWFCKDTGNPDNNTFEEFCNFFYYECKHPKVKQKLK